MRRNLVSRLYDRFQVQLTEQEQQLLGQKLGKLLLRFMFELAYPKYIELLEWQTD